MYFERDKMKLAEAHNESLLDASRNLSRDIDSSKLDAAQQLLDFKDMLIKHRARTEAKFPYTI